MRELWTKENKRKKAKKIKKAKGKLKKEIERKRLLYLYHIFCERKTNKYITIGLMDVVAFVIF